METKHNKLLIYAFIIQTLWEINNIKISIFA